MVTAIEHEIATNDETVRSSPLKVFPLRVTTSVVPLVVCQECQELDLSVTQGVAGGIFQRKI